MQTLYETMYPDALDTRCKNTSLVIRDIKKWKKKVRNPEALLRFFEYQREILGIEREMSENFI